MNIFKYTNYRLFLKDRYDELKRKSSSFSYRFFSKQCGYSSPNFLKLVIDGDRNLSEESTLKFASFFKLDENEIVYFKKLVAFDQAKTAEEKRELIKPILESTIFQRLNSITKDQYEFYAKWYYIPTLEILSTSKIKLDPKTISSLLEPRVSEREIEEALEALTRLGLAKRKDNRFVPCDDLVSTGDEVFNSLAIAEHHREMLKLASSSIDRIPGSLRDISGVTVALSDDGISKLKLMMKKFRKEILQLSEREKNKQSVYQVSMQMFPLTKVSE